MMISSTSKSMLSGLRPLRVLLVIAACASSACGNGGSPFAVERVGQALAAPVFINEIHYDNASTDAGEAIELGGVAGTDLAGYRLVLYNGTGGAVYDDDLLVGSIPNQDDGFGTLSFAYAVNGIQNGAPDGVALVDPSGAVVQFLSYEGSFVAVGGPANGLTSTDIGVAETGTEVAGASLQLVGSGLTYEDFAWSAAAPASFGGVNTAQDFTGSSDLPPSVASTTPSAGGDDVAVDASIAISFNEPASVAGSWFAIECSVSGSHAATISGGPQSYTLSPLVGFAGDELCSVTVFASQVTDLDAPADPMSADFSFSFSTATISVCGAPATSIHDVQGPGSASASVGAAVTIEGVVVGDFQGSSGLSGFFVQEEASQADADPLTSEGIFVSQGSSGVDVMVGDLVRLSGSVAESFGLTALTTLTDLQRCASGISVAPTSLSLPVGSAAALESLEGMLVRLPQTLYATETFTLGRFGEVALSANQRLFQPTSISEPGAAAQAQQAANDLAQIQLDDGSSVQNPPIPPYLASDNTLRIGDTTAGLSGVLSYAFGSYEIHPLGSVSFARTNPRQASPPNPGGSLKVASFNVLNYFTTIDTGASNCGPTGGLECRGADSTTEFTRQRDKVLAALVQMNADIAGLIELQNDASASVRDIVDGLNSRLGAGTYAFVDTGVIGTDAIKVALIYKPGSVALRGSFAVLNASVDPTFIDTLNRPVLAQTFVEIASGESLTVAVNHLKSKGSACAGDPDTGDGQGNCNLTRAAAARAEVNWLATDPTGSGDSDILIIGDLNAYAKEEPIDVLVGAGYTDLITKFVGPQGYSYVFDGQSGYLDHALASSSLTAKVSGITEWHINADEPVMLDYNQEFNPPFVYQPGPFRSSDHDPVIVGLELRSAPAIPSCNGAPATIYVAANGRVVGGPLNGSVYAGVLTGDARSNVIVGTAGNDLIRSGARGDVMCGLGGNDTLQGNLGRDILYGGEGNDLLEGGLGSDDLNGGAGNDQLVGGVGNDALLGEAGDDTLNGGLGRDSCNGGLGSDTSSACETRSNIP